MTSDQPTPAPPDVVASSGPGDSASSPNGVGHPVPLDQTFTADNLLALRTAVAAHGAALGLSAPRVADLVLLAHELASNAVRHAGASPAAPGRLRLWATTDPPAVVCEVSDTGPGLVASEQAGLEPVAVTAGDGRGLWIVRQVADVVDIVAGPTGTRITTTFLLAH